MDQRPSSPGGVFTRRAGRLVELSESPYASEDRLQALLEEAPELLAGLEDEGAAPRRWLLVEREFGVAAEEGGARWSVDHLLLDQDAVPTLVEVKRSSDTRIRREVVGQMLDYAANAVVYLPPEQIRTGLERRSGGADAAIARLVGPDGDFDGFWAQLKANLQAGRVRLVFVADRIPAELQRIVEFLNERMTPTEVLALELRQYTGGRGEQTLVPRWLGRTAAARQVKGESPGRDWDEPSWFAELERKHDEASVAVARRIFAWARERGLRFAFGRGRSDGSAFPVLERSGQNVWPIALWTGPATVELQLQSLAQRPPFDNPGLREQLRARLEETGLMIPAERLDKRPTFKLSLLAEDALLAGFFDAVDWMLEQLRRA